MPRPLQIGYLVQQFSPEVGAGPARVEEMALRWMEAGAQVTVFTGMPNRPEGRIHAAYRGKLFLEEQWKGIRVLRSWLYASPRHGFARTLLNNLTFMVTAGLNGAMQARNLDVLIASSPPLFPHVSGRLVAALRGVPLVLEVRDLWPDYLVQMGVVRSRLAARALFALERRLLRSAARVVVVTESFRARVVAKGVTPNRVEVIPNGVETGQYYPADEAPPVEALRRRGTDFIAGYLGNFGAGQGLNVILDAARLALAEAADLRFVLAGDGPEGARIAARASALHLTNVLVLPPIPKGATRAFYNACDACLVPLAPIPVFQETVPSKLFEVMACERPVVACLAGEAKDIVERSGCGVVAPPGNPRALADALIALTKMDGEHRAALGRAGGRYVRAHYDRRVLAARYLEVLQAVCHAPGASPALSHTPRGSGLHD
jgi:glycosyltransferase involved in cell wall biosynthesis